MSKNSQNVLSIKIGAEAGQGVKSAGLMLAKLAARSGYHIYNHIEFPSLIRGGHNVMQINISLVEVLAPRKNSDLLVALNQETIDSHFAELQEGSGLVFNSGGKIDTSKVGKGVNLFGVPLSQLSEEAGNLVSGTNSGTSIKKDLLINTVALGAVIGLFGGNLSILNKLLTEEFEGKGEELVKANILAAEKGFNFVLENYKEHIKETLKPVETLSSFVPNMVINGNEAAALGAISAGLQYAAIYPMSPVSNILHVLAENQEKFGYIYKQPEDEISAINMSIGASYAGARSMTATSGGGFCLMTESFGLAGMTETPLVIIEGMRPGPATGLPTWSDQGDLQMILNAHQGDFPRIVLTAGDVKETFDLTMKAFNLTEKYQTPVVLLIDKNICENDQTVPFLDISKYRVDRGNFTTETLPEYQRYKFTNEGISQRSVPGTGNFFVANSDEHNKQGYSTEESQERDKMMEKRMHKLVTCATQDMEAPEVFGPEDAEITIVSWGSNKGSILEALKSLPNVNFVYVTWMSPFPSEALKKVLAKSQFILNVECNFTGHLARLIKEKTNIEMDESFLKYDGRQVFPEEIIEKISEIQKVKGGKSARIK